MSPPRILIVAGSDSGGGAGIQADIKTVTMFGGHAMTAVTAITAQNSLGVDSIMLVPPEMVVRQMDVVIDDFGIDAVKIGMLGSAETALAVAERLEPLAGIPIVFDPVMVASSGAVLSDLTTVEAFGRLMRLAWLVTPNTLELEALSGGKVADATSQCEAVARLIDAFGCSSVLAKGGHRDGEGDRISDCLYVDSMGGLASVVWEDQRIATDHDHGTGCTLASAIATLLASGRSLEEAIGEARQFVRRALIAAPGFGAGHGPMAHWAAREPDAAG